MKTLMKFIRDEEGLTTVEYAIAGGLVGASVIAAFQPPGRAGQPRHHGDHDGAVGHHDHLSPSGGGRSPPPHFSTRRTSTRGKVT